MIGVNAGRVVSLDNSADAGTSFLVARPQTEPHLLIVLLPRGKTVELGARHLEQRLKLFSRQMTLRHDNNNNTI